MEKLELIPTAQLRAWIRERRINLGLTTAFGMMTFFSLWDSITLLSSIDVAVTLAILGFFCFMGFLLSLRRTLHHRTLTSGFIEKQERGISQHMTQLMAEIEVHLDRSDS